jgi:hypothetical protein
LKTLQVFHRLIQEGDSTFTLAICAIGPSKVLSLSKFRDKSIATEAFLNTQLVKSYAIYLEQRVLVYKSSKLIHISSNYKIPDFKSNSELFVLTAGVQVALKDLINCKLERDLLKNSSTTNAFSLLFRDSLILYKIASDAIIKLLDIYFKFKEKDDKKRGIELYEEHILVTNKLISYFEVAKSIKGINIGNYYYF